MPRFDPFFDRQPPFTFIEELKIPMYRNAPTDWGKRPVEPGEIDASGMYLATECPDDILKTSWESLNRFLQIYHIQGSRYPVFVTLTATERTESWKAEISSDGIRISGDTEGIRRALVWLEDELRRAEAPYLMPGITERHAVIRSRITRCFFSPINRAPKYGDELSDEIDYYPDEYLNRLMHDGVNGVWIYTRFSDLVDSSFVPSWGKGKDARVAKLNRVVEKCARYGIGVYVFAIEPASMPENDFANCPEIQGVSTGTYKPLVARDAEPAKHHCICVESEEGKKFVYEAGRRLLENAPGIRGFISITMGERSTSCASVKNRQCPKGTCPAACSGQLLADDVEALRSGMHSVNPACEVISWTYGHRVWEYSDILDYVERAPVDVMLMQNFDDMGYEEQLGVMRQCVDYWLSYVGPSELFTVTAEKAQQCGKHMFAKMQVCCSHEIASVPYIPVPGIIYKKYAAARAYGVEGVMQCWYFGNYPSMMSKAAGELAFVEKYEDEEAFLTSLAAIYWGRSRASQVVLAWKLFEKSYRMYPMNIMFSYYGPMHDSVVWKLYLEPKNNKLPRTWQTLDPIDGDRIGESLLQGHTLDEALTLLNGMCEAWAEGLAALTSLSASGEDMTEQISVAKAIGILFRGGRNILAFYKLRDELGTQQRNPWEILKSMETLVYAEIENSRAMIPLCEADGRLGYHSEGEGYKFFPEKILDRIAQLEKLLAEEFTRVRARIADGKAPLAYYLGEGDGARYELSSDIETAPWEMIGTGAQFRGAVSGTELTLDLCAQTPTVFRICPEYQLFTPNPAIAIHPDGTVKFGSEQDTKLYNSIFGDKWNAELQKYANKEKLANGWRLHIDLRNFGLEKARPFKMRITAGSAGWIKDPDAFISLGLSQVLIGEYGWMIPPVQ